jgi:hypothetical protein
MKKLMFGILLVIGLLGFFVPFIMVSPLNMDYDAMIGNDNVAFAICLGSIFLITGGCIGLYRLSNKFKVVLKTIGRCLLELI